MMNSSKRWLLRHRVLHLLLLGAFFGDVQASSLTLSQALQRTLERHPEILAFPFYMRESEARALQAGIRPNPTLSISVENILGDGDYQGTDAAEYQLSLSQVIEMGGKRQQRLANEQASAQRQRAQFELTRLDVLAETTRRYYQVLALQAELQWAKDKQGFERKALKAIQSRAKSGAVRGADVSNLQLHLAQTEQRISLLQSQMTIAQHELAMMWLQEPDFEALVGDLSQTISVKSLDALLSNVEHFPDYLLFSAEQRMAESALHLAQATGRADVQLTAGIKQWADTGNNAFVVSADIPLQLTNPNQGNIRASQSALEYAHQQVTWQREKLRLALKTQWLRLSSQLQNIKQIETELKPVARNYQAQAQQAYEQGLFTVQQLLDANEQAFELDRSLLEARLSAFQIVLNVERLTGEPMLTSAGTKTSMVKN